MKRTSTLITLVCLGILSVQAQSFKAKIPADGQIDLPLNLQIVIEATEPVALGTDSCFLNDELIKASTITSNGMVVFKPGVLQYATDYTFVVPDGAYVTKSSGSPVGGITIHFTTVSPKMRVFDAIVASDGTGDYSSLRAAVKAAPTGRIEPWLIFVKEGEYVELVRIAANQPYISIVGENPEKTIVQFSITSNAGHERDQANFKDAEGRGPVFCTLAPNTYVHNISLIDSWGYVNQAGPQALALGSYGDRFCIFNSKLYSYQDTWQTGSDEHRQYAKRCYIEGAVDFIYNSGDAVFDSCTIGFCRNGSVLTAPSHGAGVKYGYVFRDCNIVSSKPGTARTNNTFGRPWHNFPRCSFINTTLSKDISMTAGGWTNHMGGLPAVFAEYNTMNYQGKPVDLSRRNNWYWLGGTEQNPEQTCIAKNILSKEEADALTVRTVLSGSDSWHPDAIVQELPAPSVFYKDNRLTWTTEKKAICYEILRGGHFLLFTTDTEYTFEGEPSEYTIRAVNQYGTLGLASQTPAYGDASKLNSPLAENNIEVSFKEGQLVATGFSGTATLELYTFSGSLLSRRAIAAGEQVLITDGTAGIARITSDKKNRVLKFR